MRHKTAWAVITPGGEPIDCSSLAQAIATKAQRPGSHIEDWGGGLRDNPIPCVAGQRPPEGQCHNGAVGSDGCHWSTCMHCMFAPEEVRSSPAAAVYHELVVASRRRKESLINPDPISSADCHCGYGDCPVCGRRANHSGIES